MGASVGYRVARMAPLYSTTQRVCVELWSRPIRALLPCWHPFPGYATGLFPLVGRRRQGASDAAHLDELVSSIEGNSVVQRDLSMSLSWRGDISITALPRCIGRGVNPADEANTIKTRSRGCEIRSSVLVNVLISFFQPRAQLFSFVALHSKRRGYGATFREEAWSRGSAASRSQANLASEL